MGHYLFVLRRQNGEILREKAIRVDAKDVLRKAVKFARHLSSRGGKVIVKDLDGNVVCMIGTECAAGLREQQDRALKVRSADHCDEQ